MSDLSDIDNDLQDVFDSSSSNSDIHIEEDLGSEGTDEDTADKESADKEDKDSTVDPNSEVVVVEEAETTKSKSSELDNNSNKTKLFYKDIELFPPAKASSDVWKFGGFRKDENGKLLKDKTVCSLCGKSVAYAGSPSNFASHLKDKHSNIYKKNNSEAVKQPKMDFFLKSKVSTKYKKGNPKQKKFRKACLDWVICDKRPLSIVTDSGFQAEWVTEFF